MRERQFTWKKKIARTNENISFCNTSGFAKPQEDQEYRGGEMTP